MINLFNNSFGGGGMGGFPMGSFGADAFGGGLAGGLGGFGGFGQSGCGCSVNPAAAIGAMDPFSQMQSAMMGMMSMMMGLMSGGMMGSLMGSGGLSPMGMTPGFGGMSGGNPLANFLGGNSGGNVRRPGGKGGKGGGIGGDRGGNVASTSSAGGSYQANGPGVQAMLKKAGSMVGLDENRDRAKIQALTGKSGINPATTPWCAAFAMNLIKDHGLDDLKGLSNRNYCPTIESWARGKGKYGTPGKYKPKAGDAILFDWQGGKGTPDHIGIVEKVENGKVYTIEGNSSNGVRRKVYPLNSNVIDGYVITGKAKR